MSERQAWIALVVLAFVWGLLSRFVHPAVALQGVVGLIGLVATLVVWGRTS